MKKIFILQLTVIFLVIAYNFSTTIPSDLNDETKTDTVQDELVATKYDSLDNSNDKSVFDLPVYDEDGSLWPNISEASFTDKWAGDYYDNDGNNTLEITLDTPNGNLMDTQAYFDTYWNSKDDSNITVSNTSSMYFVMEYEYSVSNDYHVKIMDGCVDYGIIYFTCDTFINGKSGQGEDNKYILFDNESFTAGWNIIRAEWDSSKTTQTITVIESIPSTAFPVMLSNQDTDSENSNDLYL